MSTASKSKHTRFRFMARGFLAVAAFYAFAVLPTPARACGGDACAIMEHEKTRQFVTDPMHSDTNEHIMNEFKKQQMWIMTTFFRDYVVPALSDMTATLIANGTSQMTSVGGFMDGQQQLSSEGAIQDSMVKSYMDYKPNDELCSMGTNTNAIAAAESHTNATSTVLAKMLQDRHQGALGSSTAIGADADNVNRIRQYSSRFCAPSSSGGTIREDLCPQPPNNTEINMDVDYAAMNNIGRTLNLDFTDGQTALQEETVMAGFTNLFGSQNFRRLTPDMLKLNNNQEAYLQARAVSAKRSVGETAFLNVASLKSQGHPDSEKNALYVSALTEQLGAPPQDALTETGVRPSYYSLMENLNQTMYENPNFMLNLVDTPANVKRKNVSMQAMGLTLDRDQYKTELENEMMWAVILESHASRYQADVTGRLGWITGKGEAVK